ncbi:MAG: hypothetical protein RMK89_10875 [Armatimonadota bacterium]|nr:hypothetical protein [Armatimonadota bacterium]MDW8143952.1 hypothetical protein [Armatimonadota bacterium]
MIMRNLGCWLFAMLIVISGCARDQIVVSVIAEARWLNPLTSEASQNSPARANSACRRKRAT